MNFGFSEEQDELRKMVRRFFEEKSPESKYAASWPPPRATTPRSGHQMAKNLALQGLGIPEEFGGQGYGPVELYVVFEEMGAALLCSPYFSTVALAGERACSSWAPTRTRPPTSRASPRARRSRRVALTDDAGLLGPHRRPRLRPNATGDGFVLSGVRSFVTDGITRVDFCSCRP